MQAADRSLPGPSQPIGPPGAAPKLTIERFADGAVVCLTFSGTIDESFEGKKLGMTAAAGTLVLDLGGVHKISSFGIREWVDFMTAAGKHARSILLIECSPKVVDQLNMVANFAGVGRVFSCYAPFRCDYCDSEHRVRLQIDRDFETIQSLKLAERPCLSCKESMYFDEDGATYFSYLLGQDRFALEPEVEAFLANKLSYAVSDPGRKLRVDKLIEGRTTYLRLHGDLEGSFPRDKLAEGLEGTVIIDLGAIGKIAPAGAVAWRGFLGMVAPVVERVCLAAAPPTFIEKLSTRDDLNPRVQLVTVMLPYACGNCGMTGGYEVDVGAHYDVLKFATAPELRCPRCKHAMQCQAGDPVMARLPTMPRPTVGPELVTSIAILRERALAAGGAGQKTHWKPQKTTNSTLAPGLPPSAQPSARAPAAVPILAALVAVVIAAGGYLAYQRVTRAPVPSGLGVVVRRSAEPRPSWIASDVPGAALCTELAGGAPASSAPGGPRGKDPGLPAGKVAMVGALSCVGVSSISAQRDDAADEAADAAFDAVANAIAVRITDATWRAAVPPIYAPARDATLAAFARDPDHTSTRHAVREARHAVARALRATSGGVVPAAPTGRYWEEYQSPEGKRYLAFAQVTIGAAELARLSERYVAPAGVLGATVVGLFPLIGWRYPTLERGAVIVGLGPGPLEDLGLAERAIVLGVDGRDIDDAAGFGTLVGDEYASLAERGGTLRLKVLAEAGLPREFAQAVKPARQDPAPSPAPVKRWRAPNEGDGSVNVWDKLHGGRGDGRDDPTQ
ncbi:MAG TPA: hypothetical protein VHN14_12805 [Kofleriaceae bacterium]|jgi:anti-anti-sigma regulatory factor|nr:hypothetical protein [Kofleriaceae bacterium]